MKKLFNAVDAVKDPKPSGQYILRERGEEKEMPLPATNQLEGRARRWMIKPEWLLEHPGNDSAKQLADNGKHWGDERDPEEIEDSIRQMKQEKADIGRKRKVNGGTQTSSIKKPKCLKAKGKGREPDGGVVVNEANGDGGSGSASSSTQDAGKEGSVV